MADPEIEIALLKKRARKLQNLLEISELQKEHLKKERDELLEKVRDNFIS